ncbi:MAG: cytochrome D1 [Gammaproteobacteria bacterium]|nr:cytochrome D1 [Gammaproteobacteria bacterium]MDH3536447.1 cytochrome D1 [Gammaproteobacteria bacterium]
MSAVTGRGVPTVRRALTSLFAALVSMMAGISAVVASETQTAPVSGGLSSVQTMVRDGVSIEFRALPEKGGDAVTEGRYANVEFRITDAETGNPISGIYPAVWLDIAKPWEDPDVEATVSCRERVEMYMQGIIGVRPQVDLNSYFVLVMNRDKTITVIDPIIGVAGITKLYAKINLDAVPADWAKARDEKFIYVSMPSIDQVAVVDLTTFKVKGNIDAGDNPVRVALQPDEKYLWVANGQVGADIGGVSVIDVETEEKVAYIATGGGHHELAFSHDSRYAFVSNRDEGSVSVIDIGKLEKVDTIAVGEQVIGLAYSEKSEALYTVDGKSGQINVIDVASRKLKKRIDVKPGVGPAGVSQQGRWLIAANTHEDEVYAVDVATDELKHTIGVGRKPYQITFSRAFVYVRSLGSERVDMIEINHLNTLERVVASSFAAGAAAPSKAGDISLASAISEAPGEAAVLVVSPAESTVYYYMEGMNAPMGNFRNYGHRPRAVQVADRTVNEEQDGVYRAKFRVPAAGTYDAAFLMESPSILHCFSMVAERDPALHLETEAKIEFIDRPSKATAGDEVALKFRIVNPATGEAITNLKDVRVQYYRAPSYDRRDEYVAEVGDGVYQLKTQLKNSGLYYFYVSSRSSNLGLDRQQFITLYAAKPEIQSD